MANARIVTDTLCELPADIISSLDITVLPWRVRVGPEMLLDSPTLRTADFFKNLLNKKLTPSAIPPVAQQYHDAFERLSANTDQIVAITPASRIARCYDVAQQARQVFLGRTEIHVIDSTFIGRAQGILVQQAALLAMQGTTATEIVRQINGLIPRSYLGIYTDSLSTMAQRGLVDDRDDEIRGTPSYRPLLLMEEGQIVPLQRSRKRGEPADRIIEFVTEFASLSQLYFMHNGHSNLMSELRVALTDGHPDLAYEEHIYSPVFASLVGPRAFGVAAIEE